MAETVPDNIRRAKNEKSIPIAARPTLTVPDAVAIPVKTRENTSGMRVILNPSSHTAPMLPDISEAESRSCSEYCEMITPSVKPAAKPKNIRTACLLTGRCDWRGGRIMTDSNVRADETPCPTRKKRLWKEVDHSPRVRMPVLALEIGLAVGPAFEGLQGRTPRPAGRAVVMPGASPSLSSGSPAMGTWR